MYQVIFTVHCTVCNQTLEPHVYDDGVEYVHGNPADCSEPSVTLPSLTPEQLADFFGGKTEKPAKPARPKAVASPARKK